MYIYIYTCIYATFFEGLAAHHFSPIRIRNLRRRLVGGVSKSLPQSHSDRTEVDQKLGEIPHKWSRYSTEFYKNQHFMNDLNVVLCKNPCRSRILFDICIYKMLFAKRSFLHEVVRKTVLMIPRRSKRLHGRTWTTMRRWASEYLAHDMLITYPYINNY